MHFAGELPLEIIRMKVKCIIPLLGLDVNKGFTLPANIGELGDDITELNLRSCSLKGERVEPVLGRGRSISIRQQSMRHVKNKGGDS